MSWRGRDDNRSSRWGENRGRPPVWEPRRSATPERGDRKSPSKYHRERYDRDRDRDRHGNDRDRHGNERDRHGNDRDRHGNERDRLGNDRDRHGNERDRRSRESDRHRRDRSDRTRDRSRDRERHRGSSEEVPAPPSPPTISDRMSMSRSRSNSRDQTRNSQSKDDDQDEHQAVSVSPGDWFCTCGSYNFKRRQSCYKRYCFGKRSDGVVYGAGGERAAADAGITKRLLFRRLDALTTEEKILDTIKERCSKKVLDSIGGITIGRETLTGASKCLAYINFNSIAESVAALSELVALEPPLEIDGRDVLISFYNEPQKITKHQQDYSNFYPQMGSFSSSSQALSEADRVNAAAAVAQSAISAAQARNMSWAPVAAPTFVGSVLSTATNIPTGDGKTVYAPPDVRTFMYDETSGYYYDSSTGLYYDGTTQYFYNNQTNQYMYWEANSNTYISATQNHQNTEQPKLPNPPQATIQNTIAKEPEEKKKKDKDDKVKVAKKIAKDMERWAKTLNQKKENAQRNVVMEQPLDTGSSKGSADIGFSVLGSAPIPHQPQLQHIREVSPPPTDEFLMKKVPETPIETDEGIIDWAKLTCLICKRRFPSIEVLTKHKLMSDLHRQNLAEFQQKNDMPQPNGYRDRAAERRMKFGEDEPIITKRRYEPPSAMPPPMPAQPPPAVIDTIGGKMLQKMGWSAGRGLGKTEQGRIAPIEAEQRPSLAGLGQKKGIYTPTPGETYRDTVKKLMIARYKEVVGQDE